LSSVWVNPHVDPTATSALVTRSNASCSSAGPRWLGHSRPVPRNGGHTGVLPVMAKWVMPDGVHRLSTET
jgi:hypothetical protein